MSVLGTKGYERTLDEMKSQLGSVLGWKTDDDVPSASALCQARRKLDAATCTELVSQVYELCRTARSHADVGYGGYRLLAIDGTKLALPAYAPLTKHFGCPSNGDGKALGGPQAALTVLWDVGANQPVGWRVGPYRVSEQAHATELVTTMGVGDLVIGDRYFPSRRLLTQMHKRQAQVLMRVRTSSALSEVTDFLASGAEDQVINLASRDEHDRPDQADPILPVRLMRTALPDGTIAVFLTSLIDAQQHPRQALIDLYTQRWRIETAFRELKIWHGLERFHARHVDGIAQEIAAVMLFQLLASELEAQIRQRNSEQHDSSAEDGTTPRTLRLPRIRFNRRIVADCAVRLLFVAAAEGNLEDAYRYAVFRIWRYRQTIQPGRTFPRQRKTSHRGWKPRGIKGRKKGLA